MDITQKLFILADAAKYDASCASSSAPRREAGRSGGIGASQGTGICHSYGPDGRCISLFKILLTNWCIYDCLYCVNRSSSNVDRARFRIDEVVQLTLDFYRRNVIEGLFLSSGIIQTPDYTMEQVIEVARQLREEHGFKGYIHLKTIPDASDELIERAGRYADRLSINIELPTTSAMTHLAPDKNAVSIKRAMGRIRLKLEEATEQRAQASKVVSLSGRPAARARPVRFAPAGQSTQMIVGADASDDRAILTTSVAMYRSFGLKRVYYSAFSPIPHASNRLPSQGAPLLREHRLYQADWLMRFYGFEDHEIVTPGGMLSLEHDPKLAWAMAHPERFPVDLNRAEREELLRVPGLGPRTVGKILAARRVRQLRLQDLASLRVSIRKLLGFVELADYRPKRIGQAVEHRPQIPVRATSRLRASPVLAQYSLDLG